MMISPLSSRLLSADRLSQLMARGAIVLLMGAFSALLVPDAGAGLIVLGKQAPKSPEQLALEVAAESGSAESAWRLGAFLATPSGATAPADPDGAEKWLRLALAAGEKRSLSVLGKLLLETSARGENKERVTEGLSLLREAAKTEPGANLLLGLLYAGGSFVERDFKTAEGHFREAANLGDVAGTFRLGWLYSGEAGFPGEENPEMGAGHLETAFAKGNNEAGRLLVKLLREGTRLPKDEAKAFKLVSEAAARNDPESLYLVGQLYAEGVGVSPDPERALQAYLKAAAAGNAAAQNEAGMIYFLGKTGEKADLAAARKWFELSTAQGFAPAHLNLAVLLDRGSKPGSAEGRRAMENLIVAASAGILTAQDLLGAWYRDGKQSPRDLNAAAGWFRMAAVAGNLPSIINLAQIQEANGNQPGALAEALSLYDQAAKKGHAVGHFHYARLLVAGNAAPADLVKGYAHLAASAAAGFQPALENLPRFKEALSKDQLAEAEAIREQLYCLPWTTQ